MTDNEKLRLISAILGNFDPFDYSQEDATGVAHGVIFACERIIEFDGGANHGKE